MLEMTSPEKAIERLFEHVWNQKNTTVAEELVHDEYYIHDRDVAEQLLGPALYKELANRTEVIFPDMDFTIKDMVSSGEKVALRWTMTGTHEGVMNGIEPTGRQVELHAVEINHFENGQLIETWTQGDQLGLLQQVGALPADM